MQEHERDENTLEVRLWIKGDPAGVTQSLPAVLDEEGLQLIQTIQPSRRGLMDFGDVVLTIVISIATAVVANYAQDKHISARIDAALTRLKAKSETLVRWSSGQS